MRQGKKEWRVKAGKKKQKAQKFVKERKGGETYLLIYCKGAQGLIIRCHLSWLTNSALVYEPKSGGCGCGVSVNEYSCAHGLQIKFGDLTSYLTNGCPVEYIPVAGQEHVVPCKDDQEQFHYLNNISKYFKMFISPWYLSFILFFGSFRNKRLHLTSHVMRIIQRAAEERM